MEKHFLTLNDLGAYRIAFQLSNEVWEIAGQWGIFAKDTIGKQFVRSVDSISANIAEGFGRYTKREKAQFFRYSFGSVTESIDWNEKARKRELLTQKQYDHISSELHLLPRELNSLIKYYNERLSR